MKDARISGYFDTKYMTVLRIEQILHNFEDQKLANFLNLEQVNFRVTLVILVTCLFAIGGCGDSQISCNLKFSFMYIQQSSRLNDDATYGMSHEYMTFSNLYIVCRMNT